MTWSVKIMTARHHLPTVVNISKYPQRHSD